MCQDEGSLEEAIAIVKNEGGIADALALAEREGELARKVMHRPMCVSNSLLRHTNLQCLECLPVSDARRGLESMVDYVLERLY